MDPMRQCFEHYGRSPTKSPNNADFPYDPVKQYYLKRLQACLIPVVLPLASLVSDSRYTLLRNIDIEPIAGKAGTNPDQVTAALHTIEPVLLHTIANENLKKIVTRCIPSV
jgi:hypothetical protein